jgi:diguanylate cyclase
MAIKYNQSQPESAVLLRQVIAEMGHHDAPFNPATFAVCYEVLAGINPRLTEAFEQSKRHRPRLSADDMAALYRNHVAEADSDATESARGELQRVMRGVAESAASTGSTARAYGTQLAGLSQALGAEHATDDAQALRPRLDAVASGTAQMQTVVVAFEQSLREGEREVERLRGALERARIEAVTDALSKLRNRKGFNDVLRETLSTRPPAGMAHCLAVFDLDHFKRVNDTHGHPVGDTVIETVGQVLTRVSTGSNAFAARIGGEEFAVVMPSTTQAQAVQLAESVRNLVRGMKIRKRGTQEVIATVTVSAGIAAWVPGDDAASLLSAADAALYRSKQSGRDRVTVA